MKPTLKLVQPNPETKPLFELGDPVTATFNTGGTKKGMVVKILTDHPTGKIGYVVATAEDASDLPDIAGHTGVAMGAGVFDEDHLAPRWQKVN